MNPGICYLYEYKNHQKLRNVGFMKVTPHFHSCILQINARGIPVEAGDSIKLHVFYEKNSGYITKPIGDIACGDKAIYARLTTSEASYPDGKTFEEIGGFILLINGQYYAALSDNTPFDTSMIKMWEKPAPALEAESLKPTEAIPVQKPNRGNTEARTESEPEPLPPNGDAEVPEPPPHGGTEVPELPPPNGADEVPELPPPNGGAEVPEPPPNGGAEVPEPLPLHGATEVPELLPHRGAEVPEPLPLHGATDVPELPPRVVEPDLAGSQLRHAFSNHSAMSCPETSPASNDTLTSNRETHEKIKKIQRCDLSILPRSCWNLANNSFLMHGYHSYHHLLLVEEDGHYWLGIPGVYAAREAKAAELFGFPQFTQTYTDRLELDKEERNNSNQFGYWCRYIR